MQQYFILQFSQNDLYLIIYGAMFLLIILLLPEGIVPSFQKYWQKNQPRQGVSLDTRQVPAEDDLSAGVPGVDGVKKERAGT